MRAWYSGAILATLLALTGAQTAQAHYPAPLRRALAIADARWPLSPCHGREQLVSVTEEQAAAYLPGAVAWSSVDGSCRVFIAWPLLYGEPMRLKCRLLMHEFGHLAGREHSPNRRSIMFRKVWDIPDNGLACWHAFQYIPPLTLQLT